MKAASFSDSSSEVRAADMLVLLTARNQKVKMVYKWHGVNAKFNENLSGDSEVTMRVHDHISLSFIIKWGGGAR
jgi:hypothetical protein